MRPTHGILALLASVALGTPTFVLAQQSTDMLIDSLREGGYVIYMRHAATERDYADQVTADPADCATQRMLSEAGWQDARRVGESIRKLGIPVGEVLSSEYCRAWQTADLAFGSYAKKAALNFEPAEEYTEVQVTAMRDRVMPLLIAPIADGNRVIVGHDDPFEAVTGIYPEPQGVAFVLRTGADGKIEVLGSIAPDAWPGE